MFANKQRLKLALGFLIVALLAACGGAGTGNGDDSGGPGDPGGPLSISVNAEPATVEVGGDVVLTATIGGDGATPAAVVWTAADGSLSADTGGEVTWTAPTNAGNYTVTAILSVAGESVSADVQVAVTEAGGGPGGPGDPGDPGDPGGPGEPLTITVTVDPAGDLRRVVYGQSLTLTATVEGDGADEATVTWTAEDDDGDDAGEFSQEQGLTTVWTAPSSAGPVEITASITGEAVSDNVSVVVVLCNSGNSNLSDNPCVITNVQQLQAMGGHPGNHFALGDDIDAAETASWNDGAGFEPIGAFSGTLDGKGFTISDLYVNRPDEDEVGLFSVIGNNGEASDLRLTNVSITGRDYTGGLAGRNRGTIDSSSTSGEVNGEDYTGGLAGQNVGVVEASSSTAVVTGDDTVGGLIGGNGGSGTVQNSFSDNRPGDEPGVSATGNSGGLVGANWGTVTDSHSGSTVRSTGSNTGGLVGNNLINSGAGYIERSYTSSTAAVEGTWNVGGLVGNSFGFITQSYSLAGSVEGTDRIGGLVGYHRTITQSGTLVEATIDESYSMTLVSGDNNVGGLVGESMSDPRDTVTESYWDQMISRQTDSAGGTGVGTTQMLQRITFTNWDFVNDWTIDDGGGTPDLRSNPRP